MNRLIWLGAATAALSTVGNSMDDPAKTREIAPARDGNIAIEEELCAARKAGTVAAYDLFIARHPGHPLLEAATKERARLIASTGRER
jgi:hypothetical protein